MASKPHAESVLAAEGILFRLVEIIDDESKALRQGKMEPLSMYGIRKAQILRELNQVTRDFTEGMEHLERLRPLVGRVRDALAANASLLERHRDARADILELIRRAVQAAEVDGTYTQKSVRQRSHP